MSVVQSRSGFKSKIQTGDIFSRIGLELEGINISKGRTQVHGSSLANRSASGISWIGGSGRHYRVRPVAVNSFQLKKDRLYLLTVNNRPIWIGTCRDLISDSETRTQFRQASALAALAYELSEPENSDQRASLIIDLLTGHPSPALIAA